MSVSLRHLRAIAASATLVAAACSNPPPIARPVAPVSVTAPPVPRSEDEFVRAHRYRIGSADDLTAVLSRFARATVIGLGEQTHGSEENARVRVQFARAMIERLEVGTVALEADYAEVLKVDDYVQGGVGDPATILAQQRAGWIWDKPALREFVLWLRGINSLRPAGDRVHIVGIDMQTTFAIVSAIAKQIELVGKHEGLRLKVASLASCDDSRLDAASKAELDALAPRAPSLAPLLRSFEQCKRAAQEGTPGEQARERGMADNVLAQVQRGEPANPRRVIVLANNAHIAKTPMGASTSSSMGGLLGERLASKYFALGTILGDGEFRAYRFDPSIGRSKTTEILTLGQAPPDTIEAVLGDTEAFFLPLAATSAESGWPGDARRMRVIGASYAPGYAEHYLYPVRLDVAFDALVYLPRA